MKLVAQALRVNSWIKNLIIFFPLIFSLKLTNTDSLVQAVIAFFSFSFASSFIYVLNDIKDIEQDKIHSRKKNRPLPSGRISKKWTACLAIISLALCVVLSITLPAKFLYIITGYLFLNLIYIFILKKVNLIDSFSVALNFVIRILAGCFAIAVVPSKWIIIVSFFVSLFLVFIKRKSEIKMLEDNAIIHRKVLKHYSVGILDKFIFINAAITIFAYVMYTIDDAVVSLFQTEHLTYSAFFVILGLFRFIQLSESDIYDHEGDPTTLILKDRFLQIVVTIWMLYIFLFLYVL